MTPLEKAARADIPAMLANCHPSLSRGQVWCRSCGSTRKQASEQAFRTGWPKCCGYTMTIDSPEEQADHILRGGETPNET